MRRFYLLGFLLLAGCQDVAGPFYHRDHPVQVDSPCLNIEEQKRLGRDRLALPDPSRDVAPRTYGDFPAYPGYSGR
jgi:hypothetical protein